MPPKPKQPSYAQATESSNIKKRNLSSFQAGPPSPTSVPTITGGGGGIDPNTGLHVDFLNVYNTKERLFKYCTERNLIGGNDDTGSKAFLQAVALCDLNQITADAAWTKYFADVCAKSKVELDRELVKLGLGEYLGLSNMSKRLQVLVEFQKRCWDKGHEGPVLAAERGQGDGQLNGGLGAESGSSQNGNSPTGGSQDAPNENAPHPHGNATQQELAAGNGQNAVNGGGNDVSTSPQGGTDSNTNVQNLSHLVDQNGDITMANGSSIPEGNTHFQPISPSMEQRLQTPLVPLPALAVSVATNEPSTNANSSVPVGAFNTGPPTARVLFLTRLTANGGFNANSSAPKTPSPLRQASHPGSDAVPAVSTHQQSFRDDSAPDDEFGFKNSSSKAGTPFHFYSTTTGRSDPPTSTTLNPFPVNTFLYHLHELLEAGHQIVSNPSFYINAPSSTQPLPFKTHLNQHKDIIPPAVHAAEKRRLATHQQLLSFRHEMGEMHTLLSASQSQALQDQKHADDAQQEVRDALAALVAAQERAEKAEKIASASRELVRENEKSVHDGEEVMREAEEHWEDAVREYGDAVFEWQHDLGALSG